MALLPPRFLDRVVALGTETDDGTARYNATGFLCGHPTGDVKEDGERQYRIFLVTNRHVFQGAMDRKANLQVRFNRPAGAAPNVYRMPLKEQDGSTKWIVHPDPSVDIAVFLLNPQQLKDDGIEVDAVPGDTQAFSREQAIKNEISEGDGVFILGFPLGLAGDERNYVIVRQGIIARVQDWLRGNAPNFLIDASIFPGNSGGPVFLKPESLSIQGTKSNRRCVLLGMVSKYLPYRETAVSTQTGLTRMIFEENSGLGVVEPFDAIQDAMELAVSALTPGGPT